MPVIPVFALPETVVFPGMTVPLHVFEERYKRLVRECVERNDRRFIITLASPRTEISDVEGNARDVGAFVDILTVTENPDGTYALLVHGQERCRVDVVERAPVREPGGGTSHLPYSDDIPYPLERSDPNLERVAAWDALDTFRMYAKTYFAQELLQQVEDALPEDLVYQASFICANIRVPIESRQVLLEAPSLLARFQIAQKLMLERLAVEDAAGDLPGHPVPDDAAPEDPAPDAVADDPAPNEKG